MLTEKERRRCGKLLEERESWFGRFGIDAIACALGLGMLALALRPALAGSALQLAAAGGFCFGVGVTRLFLSKHLALLARLFAEHERGREPAPGA